MVDRDNVVVADRGAGRGTSLVAWVGLIVALLALWLAWMAYDRTGADLDQRIREGVERSAEGVDQGAQNAEDAVDAGPDGVDEDNTNTTTPETTPDTTTEGTDPTQP